MIFLRFISTTVLLLNSVAESKSYFSKFQVAHEEEGTLVSSEGYFDLVNSQERREKRERREGVEKDKRKRLGTLFWAPGSISVDLTIAREPEIGQNPKFPLSHYSNIPLFDHSLIYYWIAKRNSWVVSPRLISKVTAPPSLRPL